MPEPVRITPIRPIDFEPFRIPTPTIALPSLWTPDWSLPEGLIGENCLTRLIHLGLDIAGFVPVFGELADLANAALYFLQGNYEYAAYAAAAAIPFLGWAATSAKYGRKTEKYIRYTNKIEADQAISTNKLHPKPGGNPSQPKRIAEPGAVDPKKLGQRKQYSEELTIETKPGTKEWLKENSDPDAIPGHDPDEVFAIPGDKLDEFNDRILNITGETVR